MLRKLRSRQALAVLAGLAIVIVIVVLALGGDGDDGGDGISDIVRGPEIAIEIRAGEPIIVGVSTALTGPTESLGSEARDAAAVAVRRWKEANGDQILGHDIELRVEDDGCFEADVTVQAAERLLSVAGLVGVIGPMCSDGAAKAIPTYAEAGIVIISGSATRTDLTTNQPEGGFFFRTAFTNAQEGAEQARYVFARIPEVTTAYVIDDGEAYGMDLAGAAQAALEAGGRVVTRESIVTGSVDFSELAGRIAADKPDLVIFEGFNPEGALLYRQLRDAGYDGWFISGDGVVSTSDFIDPLGDQAEGALLTGCSPSLPEEYLDDFTAAIGHAPTTTFAGHIADAVTVLLDAVAQVAQPQADGSLVIEPLDLRDEVSTPGLLAGLSGPIAFDANGDRVGQGETVGLAMCVVEGGQFVNLDF